MVLVEWKYSKYPRWVLFIQLLLFELTWQEREREEEKQLAVCHRNSIEAIAPPWIFIRSHPFHSFNRLDWCTRDTTTSLFSQSPITLHDYQQNYRPLILDQICWKNQKWIWGYCDWHFAHRFHMEGTVDSALYPMQWQVHGKDIPFDSVFAVQVFLQQPCNTGNDWFDCSRSKRFSTLGDYFARSHDLVSSAKAESGDALTATRISLFGHGQILLFLCQQLHGGSDNHFGILRIVQSTQCTPTQVQG